MDGYVVIGELANRVGMDRSNTRKYALRHGFEFARIRTLDSRGQLTLALSESDADALVQVRESEGFGPKSTRPIENGIGYFYALQLVPDLDPRRIKLGFAAALDTRLVSHRTAAPTSALLRSWPCRRSWEIAAFASLARGYESIGLEVVICPNPEEVVVRGDAFFALMPPVA